MIKIILMLIALSCSKSISINELRNINKGINEDLIKYCEEGNKEKIIELLNRGANVNFKDEEGNTPLSSVFNDKRENEDIIRREEIIKLLIKRGANVEDVGQFKYTPLRLAIKNKNFEILKILIEEGANVNYNNDGTPILFEAIENKYIEGLKLLLEKGAYVNSINHLTENALMFIIKKLKENKSIIDESTVEIVKILIEKGINIYYKNQSGNTALTYSVVNEQLDILKILIEYQANPNEVNNFGYTPFIYAISSGNLEIIKTLIRGRANANISREIYLYHATNATPEIIKELGDVEKGINEDLIRYCREGKKKEALYLLTENPNINVNFKDKNGNTALYYAFEKNEKPDISGELVNTKIILRSLLERMEDINLKDSKGCSPLFRAIDFEYVDIVEFLLKKGADVILENEYGFIPFRHALNSKRNNKIAKVLLKAYKQNFKDRQGYTLLMHSVFENNKKMVKNLVEREENIDEKDNNGKTALMHAIDNENLDIVNMLLNLGSLCEGEYKEKLNRLIDKMTDIYFKDEIGNGNLILLAEKGELEAVKLLLEKGADINYRNSRGISALSNAVCYGHAEITKILLERGANIKDKGYNYENLLIESLNRGYQEIAKLFIGYGADIHAKCKYGFTALIYALKNNCIDIAEELIEKGADVNAANDHYDNSLSHALESRNLEMIKLIVGRGFDLLNYGRNALSNISKKIERFEDDDIKEYTEMVYIIIIKMVDNYIQLFMSMNENPNTTQEEKDEVNNQINILYSLRNLPAELIIKIIAKL